MQQQQQQQQRNIWLLSGHAGTGKDTAAAIMLEVLGSNRSAISSFAGAAKDAAAARYGIDRDLFDSQAGKATIIASGKTVRELLIEHAEGEKVRTNDSYIWVKRLAPPAESVMHWILSDWRFLAEHAALKAQYPCSRIHTIRIERTVGASDSYTEHELDGVDFEARLDNSGSLLHLKQQILDLLTTI